MDLKIKVLLQRSLLVLTFSSLWVFFQYWLSLSCGFTTAHLFFAEAVVFVAFAVHLRTMRLTTHHLKEAFRYGQ